LSNDSYTRLGISGSFAVSTVSTGQPSLTVNPTNVAPSGTVTATWNGTGNTSSLDWIGLYARGATNRNFIDWIYVSCSKTPASGRSSGSCPFVIPTTLSTGSYVLRLFANNGYKGLTNSRVINVSSTKSSVLTQASSNGGGSSSGLVSQAQNPSDPRLTANLPPTNGDHAAQRWSDYRFSVKLQSMDDDGIGPVLEIWIDGNRVFSVRDTSLSSGTIGLYSWFNQGSIFDDILVTDPVGTVLLSDDFNVGNFTDWTIVDEDGAREGPSQWSAATGALVQSSNIGADNTGRSGTFALYTRW
jgi:hypothetical protein